MRRRLSIVLGAAAALALAVPAAAAAAPPTVVNTWVTSVGATSAVVHAETDPEGLPTSYRIEYVTEAAFLASGFAGAVKVPTGSELSVGSGSVPVETIRSIGGLQVASPYRYRIVATNSGGSTPGPTRTLGTDEEAPVFSLPDSRGWEMVSPIDKNGGEVQGFGANFGGDVLQAAGSGAGEITYTSRSSFGNAQGAPGANQYISRRSGSGWSTDNVSLATESGAYGDHPDGVPYRLFSPDLSLALILDGHRCEVEPCPRSYSLRTSASAALTPLPYEETDLAFAGASPELAHIVLSTCAALTAESTEVLPGECDPAKPELSANLYERSGSTLRLINLRPGDTTGTPGATLAAQNRAISADGTRVYWSDGTNLYLRQGNVTMQVDEDAGGGGSFQTASLDGSAAFFTTEAGHLWRYLPSSDAATDLTPGGGVEGVLGASEDGAYVYYETSGGLFLWHSGAVTAVGIVAAATNYPPTAGTARVSADGHRLAFVSSAAAPGYDNRNATTGVFEPEVYLYTAPVGAGLGTLVCSSCNPSGERPIGPASLPGASPNGTGTLAPRVYKPRALSVGSGRLFFDSFDSLAPQDTNKDRDVYQWEAQGTGTCSKLAGCVSLISSGRSEDGASFVDATVDGSDAFFLTDGSLVPDDPGSVDVYDARIGGGFPVPPDPIICIGDACQPLPPEPEDPTPGTIRSGRTNPPATFPKPNKPCKKGQVKKKGKCVKKAKHRNHKGGGSK